MKHQPTKMRLITQMKKKVFYALILFLQPILLNAQTTSFQHLVNGPLGTDNSQGTKIALSSDGGYLVAGGINTSTSGFASWMPKITKTDMTGDVIYSTRINVTGLIWDIIENTSGNCVAIGTVSSGPTSGNIFLVEVNSCGVVQWLREFGNGFTSEAKSLIQTSDGGYLIAGTTQTSTASSSRRATLWKTFVTGNLSWVQCYGSIQTAGLEAIQTSDGGFILSGSNGSSLPNPYVVKTTNTGAVTWGYYYQLGIESSNQGQGAGIRQLSGGDYVVFNKAVGSGGRRIGIMKLDTTGNVTLNKAFIINADANYGTTQTSTYGGTITSNGELVIFAVSSVRTTNFPELMLMRCNASNLDPIWGKTYGIAGTPTFSGAGGFVNGIVSNVKQTSDGGFAFTGISQGSPSRYYLAKVFSNGGATCNDNNITVTNFTATATRIASTSNPTNTVVQVTSALTSQPSFPFFMSNYTNLCSGVVSPVNPNDTIPSLGIIGPTNICPTPFTGNYSVINPGAGYTLNWVVSGGTINSGQGTNAVQVTWNTNGPNTITLNYTGPCAYSNSISLQVGNSNVTPTFNPIAAICSGGTFTLPTTSTNGINGTWSPAINNTATTTYTFTPTAGQCATTATLSVTVNPSVTPTFNPIAPICVGGTFTLPTTSTNGITGTWSPAINNTATTTYTFTPAAGQCATTAPLTVNVGPPATPTFNPIAPICVGGTFTLPISSTNGITGTWSPAINNTATTTYTFTPTAGQCATTTTLTVNVGPPATPTFNPIASICSGGTITLPSTSINGFTGTWSPAVNNTATTTYTFTPTAGQCASTAAMTVIVNSVNPPANAGNDFSITCSNNINGGQLGVSPSTGFTYNWSPGLGLSSTSLSNPISNPTNTTTYTLNVTSNSNGCSSSDQVIVTLDNSAPNIYAGNDQTICKGDTTQLSGSGAQTYVWENGIIDGAFFVPSFTQDYIVTGTGANDCQDNDTVTIFVNIPTTSTITESAIDSYTLNGQTYTQSGIYTQVLTNGEGCDSTITLNLTLNYTGINEIGNINFTVYPNPTSDLLNVITPTESNENFIIIDSRGRKVLQGNLFGTENLISLKALKTGTYFLKIGQNEVPIRVVKQ
jgi:hypothetical protein